MGKHPNARQTSGNIQICKKNGSGRLTIGTSEWEGWGTAIKPAHQPIVMARKPISQKSVTENILKWGTGGLNIDKCRIQYVSQFDKSQATPQGKCTSNVAKGERPDVDDQGRPDFERPELRGRFPANLIHDGSNEVLQLFPHTKSGNLNSGHKRGDGTGNSFMGGGGTINGNYGGDSGSAARFFYCAKASKSQKNAGIENQAKVDCDRNPESYSANTAFNRSANPKINNHPTVKPVKLMEYLINLVTPQSGVVLDPFGGSGTTAIAAINNGFKYILIQRQQEYCDISRQRIQHIINAHN